MRASPNAVRCWHRGSIEGEAQLTIDGMALALVFAMYMTQTIAGAPGPGVRSLRPQRSLRYWLNFRELTRLGRGPLIQPENHTHSCACTCCLSESDSRDWVPPVFLPLHTLHDIIFLHSHPGLWSQGKMLSPHALRLPGRAGGWRPESSVNL